MSNIITITKHLYITKWGIQQFHRGEPVETGEIYLYDDDSKNSDWQFYLCPVEVQVDIPSEEQAHLLELAGLEAERDRVMRNSLRRMAALDEQIAELKALTFQEEKE